MKAVLFFIKAQKAFHILKEEGLKALISRIETKANIRSGKITSQTGSISDHAITETKAIFVGKILNKEKLQSKTASILTGSVIRIAFSHNNYLENVGGLQLKIADEQLAENRSGKGYLHIFPYNVGLSLVEFNKDSVIGINLNGEWVGYTRPQILIDFLSERSSELDVDGLSIHQLMGFDLGFIEKVIEISRFPKVSFWLHDFFSLCPGYLLLRNNVEFCGAPDVKSNACSLCVYGERRLTHLEEFERFFLNEKIEVFSPSEFALNLWKKAFPIKGVASKVCPLVSLEYQEPSPNTPRNSAIKVAFVGFPVYHKGWDTWLRLTDKFGSDPRYEFILFSETRRTSRNFKNISVSVTKKDRNQMADLLLDNNIDIAFLWSICPETFSFTLYESLAAGCTIVTNRNSGNIQAYVSEHPETGLVLDNEKALMEMFEGSGLDEYLTESQKLGKKPATIIIN